jgi:prepilin-type N-terminal cleavage/methylation domain-containing protein
MVNKVVTMISLTGHKSSGRVFGSRDSELGIRGTSDEPQATNYEPFKVPRLRSGHLRAHGCAGVLGGFTLLELILVMVILSTVLAMAAPSLRGFFGSRKTHDEAAQLLALTQYARSAAISEGVTYRLNFDMNKHTYWLTSQKAGIYEHLKTEFGYVFTFPNDITVELEDVEKDKGDMFLAFTPQGTVTAGTIRLIDRRGLVLEITCPTVTESFSIVEREQNNGKYISKQNS